ncbi:MAG: glycoside hydrolase family 3 C-terminal domain-containing protein [Pseudomonadota bacterium]
MRANSGLRSKHNEAATLVAQMTLEEKARLASGRDFWHLDGCERLGLAPVMVTDGPHGLRKQATGGDHVGLNRAVPATCFPTASGLAATWDLGLLHEIGVALGEQCVAEDVAVLLGPGMNIKRHPLCGRNFEYFSEDPLLTGELAAALVNGVQSQGVGTSIKHFAVNNQELGRMYVDAIVDERTLREIYLRGFEIAVKKAQPWTVMCAYNRVNGVYCGEHDWLLNRVLRDEWGFEGLVVTDWGATNDRVAGVTSGLDLEMPASGGINDRRIVRAVTNGELAESDLDRMIERNVALALCGADTVARRAPVDHDAHHALARRAATQSAVLLTNDGVLPLAPAARISVIGAFAKTPRYQGTGSSQVNPTRLDCAFDALAAALPEAELNYAPGYEAEFSPEDAALINAAATTASDADVAIVFAGLPVTFESEGFDRSHMDMPAQHNRLIEAVCAAQPNTVVVLANGAPVAMPWVEQPRAILEAYLGGQAGGSAVVDLLLGVANPSGKLAETFPLAQSDVPADKHFPGANRQVQYREGLYVGYRYFDTAGADVLFPFGHGLSYTTFEFDALDVAQIDDALQVSFALRNAGARVGAEVAQVFVHKVDDEARVWRPQQELKAFARCELAPDEREDLRLAIPLERLAIFDPGQSCWMLQPGEYEIRVGASSRDIRLTARVTLHSEHAPSAALTIPGPRLAPGAFDVGDETFAAMLGKSVPPPEPERPYHMNSSLLEIGNQGWFGRRFKARVVTEFRRNMGISDGADPTLARMFEEIANHMPLRSLALFSGGKMNFEQLEMVLSVLNGRYLRALRQAFASRSESRGESRDSARVDRDKRESGE